MELTVHGSQRIFDRTKMMVKDVLSVISSDAVVKLGSANGREFLLFYSPPDRKVKIAVIDAKHAKLVSIWEADYGLPAGVRRVDDVLENAARHRFAKWTFQRLNKHLETPEVQVVVEVMENRKFVNRYEVGSMPEKIGFRKDRVFRFLLPRLREIVAEMEKNRKKQEKKKKKNEIRKRAEYNILLFRPGMGYAFRVYTLKHTDAIKLAAA